MGPEPPAPRRWRRGPAREIARTRVFSVREHEAEHPVTGAAGTFVVIDAPDWVNVVAVTPDGRVVLVEQYRHGTDRVTLELPGGTVEAGEDPVAAGRRELREETGYDGESSSLVGWCEPNPAIQANRCWFVAVLGARPLPSGAQPDPMEDLVTRLEPLARVEELVRAGDIRHALVLAALSAFADGRRREGSGGSSPP